MKSTHIDHTIRTSLGLSNDQYVMMDYISSLKKIATFEDYKKHIGFDRSQTHSLLVSLRDKELIVRNEAGYIKVSDKWAEALKRPDRIDEIWPFHKSGTKSIARKRLPYVLKKITMEELKAKLVAYLKWCEEYDVFSKGLDTWLNPEAEHWNAELAPRKKKVQYGQKEVPKKETKFIIV